VGKRVCHRYVLTPEIWAKWWARNDVPPVEQLARGLAEFREKLSHYDLAVNKTKRMAFGPSSLSRIDCPKCKEVTLHRSNICIHCGLNQTPAATKDAKEWNGNPEKGIKR
jgi:hypothetical protein